MATVIGPSYIPQPRESSLGKGIARAGETISRELFQQAKEERAVQRQRDISENVAQALLDQGPTIDDPVKVATDILQRAPMDPIEALNIGGFVVQADREKRTRILVKGSAQGAVERGLFPAEYLENPDYMEAIKPFVEEFRAREKHKQEGETSENLEADRKSAEELFQLNAKKLEELYPGLKIPDNLAAGVGDELTRIMTAMETAAERKRKGEAKLGDEAERRARVLISQKKLPDVENFEQLAERYPDEAARIEQEIEMKAVRVSGAQAERAEVVRKQQPLIATYGEKGRVLYDRETLRPLPDTMQTGAAEKVGFLPTKAEEEVIGGYPTVADIITQVQAAAESLITAKTGSEAAEFGILFDAATKFGRIPGALTTLAAKLIGKDEDIAAFVQAANNYRDLRNNLAEGLIRHLKFDVGVIPEQQSQRIAQFLTNPYQTAASRDLNLQRLRNLADFRMEAIKLRAQGKSHTEVFDTFLDKARAATKDYEKEIGLVGRRRKIVRDPSTGKLREVK